MAPVVIGTRGHWLPEAVLRATLATTRPDDPGLLSLQAVEALFHEFGHVLNHLLGVQQWDGTSGDVAAFDFTEVPSNTFALVGMHPAVLRTIARHYRTGAPLPAELLPALAQTAAEGAMDRRLVIARARLALELHDRPPGPVNIDSIALATLRESVPLELPAEEMHAEAGFMHLAGYAAAYYTYPWSQVIAADLASRFEANPLDPEVGREFPRAILEGGRAVPVEKKIEAFLGRPFRLDAWVKSIP